MKNNTIHRFNPHELLDLDAFLRNQTSNMSLVKAHGFITAIVSFPDLFMPSEWIPLLVGELKFSAEHSPSKKMLDKLLDIYRQVTESLNSNQMFEFLLSHTQPEITLEDAPYSCIQEWCNGYCLALVWNEEEWLYAEETFITQACATFFMLTDLITTNAKLTSPSEWKQNKKRLIKNLPDLVKALHAYWLGKQDQMFNDGLRDLQNKNPCPCGSSKQYNQCCLLEKAEAVIH
jgi:yecA family protein